jgi:hypothetical protein
MNFENFDNVITSENSVTLEVTVENLSPENGGVITPVWFGIHDGSFDTFEVEGSASSGVEFLAEDGITGLEGTVPGLVDALINMDLDPNVVPPTENTISGIFAGSSAGQNQGIQGLLATPEQPVGVRPGESLSTTIDIDTENIVNNRFLSYGAMFIPSNDTFVANDQPIEIFDAQGNFIGQDIFITRDNTFDAGTEVNDESLQNVPVTLDVVGNGISENGIVQPFSGFQPSGSGGIVDLNNGAFANADISNASDPIARISINPVINSTSENDLVYGSNNRERIKAFEGDDLVFSHLGDDTVEGGSGNDYILGSSGQDSLSGDSGDDLIDGGSGDDLLNGGLESDKFVLRSSEGQDRILDYEDGVDSFYLMGGLNFTDLSITQDSDGVIFSAKETGETISYIIGAESNDITVEDFLV